MSRQLSERVFMETPNMPLQANPGHYVKLTPYDKEPRTINVRDRKEKKFDAARLVVRDKTQDLQPVVPFQNVTSRTDLLDLLRTSGPVHRDQ